MPTVKLNLERPPFPRGGTLDEIKRDPLSCLSCFNLYPGTAWAFGPRYGLNVQSTSSALNIRAAERLGTLEPEPPSWTPRGGNRRIDYDAWEARTRLTDILKESRRGCPSCALIVEAVTRVCPGSISFEDDDLVAYLTFCSGRVLWIIIFRERIAQASDSDEDDGMFYGFADPSERLEEENREELIRIEVYTLQGHQSPWPTIGSSMPFSIQMPGEDNGILDLKIGGVARNVVQKSESEPGLRRIASWIDSCAANHESCREAVAKVQHLLPKRVLHVGSHDNTSIRLVEHEGSHGPESSYVALSHRWGKLTPPKLTIDTRDMKKANVPWSSLTKTFQDAILITRGLGIEYIWIDSLCIIQDDAADWTAEAAKMASVYEGALLVISATASVTGDEGCLLPRQPFLEIQGTGSRSEDSFTVFSRRTIKHDGFLNDRNGDFEPLLPEDPKVSQQCPLFTRAWCFQERLLATRILHFLRDEMIFECLSSLDCECGMMDGYTENNIMQLKHGIRLGRVPENDELVAEDDKRWVAKRRYLNQETADDRAKRYLKESWHDVITSYCQMSISFPSDTLPALAGLASRWSRMTQSRYLCGLWADSLLPNLLWMVDRYGSKSIQRRTIAKDAAYIAPTWSWASTQQEILFIDHQEAEFSATVDVERSGCEYSGPDVFGAVTAGWLLVTGNIMNVTVHHLDAGWGLLTKNGVTTEFTPDDSRACQGLLGSEVVCLHISTTKSWPSAYPYTALILIKADEGDAEESEQPSLIPQAVKDLGDIYKRIGITRRYEWVEWNHDTESQETTLVLI